MLSDEALIFKAKELYLNGKNIDDIAKIVGRTGRTIRSWLTKLETFEPFKTKHLNINFFQKIDSEEKAYWLGFIYADGSINQKHHLLTIGLNYKDQNHLQKLAKIFNKELKFYTYNNSVRLIINSKILYNDLVSHGIEENKSHAIFTTILNHIDDKLVHHFLRGYFDGDGSINYRFNDIRKCRFSLVGILDFMEKVQKIMENQITNLSKVKLYFKSDNICYLNYNKLENIKDIYKWMYKDSTVWLERKRLKFENSFGDSI